MTGETIDIHMHVGAPPDPESGCYWSKKFERSVAYWAVKLVTRHLFKKVTLQGVEEHLLGVINGSRYVHKCVLLAMDQVYDEGGVLHREKTHLHVPNAYLAGLAERSERILFGASIHPYRSDWERELQDCLDRGCVLCKWIPSSQQIDPSNPRCRLFFKKLAEAELPLLCHVGPELAIPPFDKASQRLNSPALLRNALNDGAIVILAHAAVPFLPPPLESRRYFEELVRLFRMAEANGWRLYTDLSSLNLGPRFSYIGRIKNEIPPDRLLFGSDYPIPILDISQGPRLSLRNRLKYFFQTLAVKNPLDKNYLLTKNLGFDEALFSNALYVLRLR